VGVLGSDRFEESKGVSRTLRDAALRSWLVRLSVVNTNSVVDAFFGEFCLLVAVVNMAENTKIKGKVN
jgi:hypothetical protein